MRFKKIWMIPIAIILWIGYLLLAPPKEGSLRYIKLGTARGEANAQFHLAHLYYTRVLGEPDDSKAAEWFRSAADRGHPYAANAIAAHLRDGRGVEKDLAEARRYYLISARKGHSIAQQELARLCRMGLGGPENLEQAAYWHSRAAQQGSSHPQRLLGGMYTAGVGVRKDLVEAYKWYSIAAADGSSAAAKSKQRLKKRLTAGQIAEAESLAKEWEPSLQELPSAHLNFRHIRGT
jgi:uncharacterized protein